MLIISAILFTANQHVSAYVACACACVAFTVRVVISHILVPRSSLRFFWSRVSGSRKKTIARGFGDENDLYGNRENYFERFFHPCFLRYKTLVEVWKNSIIIWKHTWFKNMHILSKGCHGKFLVCPLLKGDLPSVPRSLRVFFCFEFVYMLYN